MTELDIRQREEKPLRTGITRALLVEIADSLAAFVETGAEHVIDLKSLPMTPGDLAEIDDRLGIGEVRADLTIIGKSEVWETSYAGVWRVRHYGAGDAPAADEVVIARAPRILFTHPDDARDAATRLRADNETLTTITEGKDAHV